MPKMKKDPSNTRKTGADADAILTTEGDGSDDEFDLNDINKLHEPVKL